MKLCLLGCLESCIAGKTGTRLESFGPMSLSAHFVFLQSCSTANFLEHLAFRTYSPPVVAKKASAC